MYQISSRFLLCFKSSSLLRKNLFTRWSSSSKPISSSSNLIKIFISKLDHNTFSYPSSPPQNPVNHNFRKFSGEASQCDFADDDYLKKEIQYVQTKRSNVRFHIESSLGYVVPLEDVDDLADKFNALMEKLGLETLDDDERDYDDYPHHLQKFRKEIKDLVESVEVTVAFGEFVAAGGERRWEHFMDNYECMLNYHEILASLRQIKIRSRLMRKLIGHRPSTPKILGNQHFKKFSEGAAECNFGDDDYLKNEIWKVRCEQWNAQEDVERGIVPPLDVVKVLADKYNSLMEKLGLETLDDDEKYGDYPHHLQRFREDIENIEYYADMTVAFGEYVAAGGERSWQPFMGNYRCMLNYEKILASLRQMKIRSRLMRRLIEENSDSQSAVP